MSAATTNPQRRTAAAWLVVGLLISVPSVSCSSPSEKTSGSDGKATAQNPAGKAKSGTNGKNDKSQTKAKKKPARRFFPGKRKSDDQVLRHAVFFSFKETSSKDDVRKVVDAFRALPKSIKEIIDFQWGINNSPENRNDGYTHAFILTFKDEAGRAAYLPHKAHEAFGNILRPHMKAVFVIDYWASPAKIAVEKELKHAVFFKFKDAASDDDVAKVETAFAALPGKIDTIKGFEWGHNNSPERHYKGITHCFMLTFGSEAGRATYLPHAAHKEFGKLLGPYLEKVIVIDFWAEK